VSRDLFSDVEIQEQEQRLNLRGVEHADTTQQRPGANILTDGMLHLLLEHLDYQILALFTLHLPIQSLSVRG
jgi:hypothetical protein